MQICYKTTVQAFASTLQKTSSSSGTGGCMTHSSHSMTTLTEASMREFEGIH